MLLRIGIFGALFFSIFWGIIDTFMDPTPEATSQILNPTPERISKSKSLVDPFLDWARDLTPGAVVQLFKDADDDVRTKLADNPLPIGRITAVADTSLVGLQDGKVADGSALPSSETQPAAGTAPTAGDPGIDWYRKETGLKPGPP